MSKKGFAVDAAHPVAGAIAEIGKHGCCDLLDEIQGTRVKKFFKRLELALEQQHTWKEGEIYPLVDALDRDKKLKELLFDFIQAVTLTNSKLAITMLAVAYSKILLKKDEDGFYRDTCVALRQITDGELEFFERITDPAKIEGFINSNPNIANTTTRLGFDILTFSEVSRWINGAAAEKVKREDILRKINSLKRKDMLLAYDATSVDEVGLETFGVGEYSKKFRELLLKAKEISVDGQAH